MVIVVNDWKSAATHFFNCSSLKKDFGVVHKGRVNRFEVVDEHIFFLAVVKYGIEFTIKE